MSTTRKRLPSLSVICPRPFPPVSALQHVAYAIPFVLCLQHALQKALAPFFQPHVLCRGHLHQSLSILGTIVGFSSVQVMAHGGGVERCRCRQCCSRILPPLYRPHQRLAVCLVKPETRSKTYRLHRTITHHFTPLLRSGIVSTHRCSASRQRALISEPRFTLTR